MYSEDIENIKLNIYYGLRPFIRKSLKRQFKVNISRRFFKHLKEEELITGKFKDASSLIESLSLPTFRVIEPGKNTTAARFEARIANGKIDGGFKGKPWLVIRFIRINDF